MQDRLASTSKHVDILSNERKDLEAELGIMRQNMPSTLSENKKYWRERNDFSGMNQVNNMVMYFSQKVNILMSHLLG